MYSLCVCFFLCSGNIMAMISKIEICVKLPAQCSDERVNFSLHGDETYWDIYTQVIFQNIFSWANILFFSFPLTSNRRFWGKNNDKFLSLLHDWENISLYSFVLFSCYIFTKSVQQSKIMVNDNLWRR